jgi:sulfhydrogenase subunit beta (sulfur reductase)
VILERAGLDALIQHLTTLGYQVLGPVARNGAIVHETIRGVDDLPMGWHDEQAPGTYRLRHDAGDPELFGWAVGPQSWKTPFFPPREELWRAHRDHGHIVVEHQDDGKGPFAMIGARPCELAGLEVLDRVLAASAHADERYRARRRDTFVVAVECGSPAGTCFCTSMSTGPAASTGFDLALTELPDGHRGMTSTPRKGHRFLLRSGSDRGAGVLEAIPHHLAASDDLSDQDAVLETARSAIGRRLETEDLPELLARNLEHPRWTEVAGRCLSCGNCTMVCPTCFCSDVRDITDLSGEVTRRRTWSSCFDLEHSYLHGGSVRTSIASRYRQWATHKLSTWHDQFGTSGCVGCGRCIAWCPVGIDITEEVGAIRSQDGRTI